ncbi:ParB N-terminal domain-containing protein [Nocardia sp. NBC_01730]|uniref:ParB/RepB/Spo0J family partition protein n=1 Tax=Nocardia sp. NBC_01730 TaxID=2975998 RepID=UPI002E101A77|nr:ParB N-terminal domain-containing protein [Nocardia sp. NBC_01730]
MSLDTDTPTVDLDAPPATDHPDPLPAIDDGPAADTAARGDSASTISDVMIDADADADDVGGEAHADSGSVVVVGPGEDGCMDPALLDIADNVRKSFRLEDYPEVTESIKEHGVKNPIKAIRMPDGRIVVRDGQVRTLTALAFAQERVPVWLCDADETLSAKESEIARISEQITVNDRRIPLTDGDRAAGIADMLDFGASVTRVARELQIKRDQVKLAGKVGASPTARGLVDDGQFDFEQAAIIGEYEAVGDTDAVERLLNAARYNFNYTAKLVAADRDEQRAFLAAALPYAEAGFGVLTDYPDIYVADPEFVSATDLVDANGEAIGAEQIHTDPGRWLVWVEKAELPVYVEVDTGAIVDPDTVDWATAHDPERTPAEGKRHASEVEERDQWPVEYLLPTDQLAAANVFLPANEPTEIDNPDTADGDDDTDDAVDDGSAAELAAQRRAEAEVEAEARREQERQAARRVRELNKQGLAAEEARKDFVTKFLKRNSLPVVASKFIAEALASDSGLLGEYNALENALELLGISGGWRPQLLQAVDSAKPARCQVIVLGLVFGAYEKRTNKDCWRYSDRGVRHYLGFLRELGHYLVPVELSAIGELAFDQIDIDNPTHTVDLDQAA